MPAHLAPDYFAVSVKRVNVVTVVRCFERSCITCLVIVAAWKLSLFSKQFDGSSSNSLESELLCKLRFLQFGLLYRIIDSA